jgi:shikimate kinase
MKRVFLTGYMGAGKTTLGRELAKLTKLSFIDLDHFIEGRYYKTVSKLFEEKGEAVFREIEREMLHEIALFENVVISTGGGTPCFFNNMSFMNRAGDTVYLKVSPQELTKRLAPVKYTRPLLKELEGERLLDFVSGSLREREPFYRQARIVFDAENMFSRKDVRNVSAALGNMLSEL